MALSLKEEGFSPGLARQGAGAVPAGQAGVAAAPGPAGPHPVQWPLCLPAASSPVSAGRTRPLRAEPDAFRAAAHSAAVTRKLAWPSLSGD